MFFKICLQQISFRFCRNYPGILSERNEPLKNKRTKPKNTYLLLKVALTCSFFSRSLQSS